VVTLVVVAAAVVMVQVKQLVVLVVVDMREDQHLLILQQIQDSLMVRKEPEEVEVEQIIMVHHLLDPKVVMVDLVY